jgi:hypothetical protein
VHNPQLRHYGTKGARAPLSDLGLVDLDADHCISITGNMLFAVWWYRTTAPAYERLISLTQSTARRSGRRVGLWQVVEGSATPPDAAARSRFLELIRLEQIAHYSVTHEGTGFKAASVRSIVAWTQAMAAHTCAHGVHKTVVEGAAWHAAEQAKLGLPSDSPGLLSHIQALRQRRPVSGTVPAFNGG